MKYRIVTDKYAGYEVQIWRWYWPFWVQLDIINTHTTIERAKKHIESHKRGGLERRS